MIGSFGSFVYWIIAVMWALMTLDLIILGFKGIINELERGF